MTCSCRPHGAAAPMSKLARRDIWLVVCHLQWSILTWTWTLQRTFSPSSPQSAQRALWLWTPLAESDIFCHPPCWTWTQHELCVLLLFLFEPYALISILSTLGLKYTMCGVRECVCVCVFPRGLGLWKLPQANKGLTARRFQQWLT